MRLLEYEAKNLLQSAGITTPSSILIDDGFTASDLHTPVVLKSQVPVGGRGKSGGVKIVTDRSLLHSTVAQLLSLEIKGFTPKRILAEEKLEIKKEYYLSLVINKPTAEIQLLAHENGGIDVEESNTDSFLTITLSDHNAESASEQLSEYFNLPNQSFALQDMIKNLYRCFIGNDAILLEINPLIYTADDTLIAGDCKMMLDDAAAFRHRDWRFEDQIINTNFVTLDTNGSIATIANGAGLAMATVDAVTRAGMTPANFLDIGGGASSESVLAAFKKITDYPHVKAIVINIFAGITRCDEVAKAIIEARQHITTLPLLYIRLAGTNIDIAEALLSKHNIPLLPTLEACLLAAKEEVDRG